MQEIYWKDLIEKLNNRKVDNAITVDFRNEHISFKDAALLNMNGFRVPENLIEYNDSEIDYSDDPAMTDEEFHELQAKFNLENAIPMDNEIRQWIKDEQIDIKELTSRLIKNFYETIKNMSDKAAF